MDPYNSTKVLPQPLKQPDPQLVQRIERALWEHRFANVQMPR